MADQIRITGFNSASEESAGSGVYELRLNFNDSVKWGADGGTSAKVLWDHAMISFDPVSGSRPTGELATLSGELSCELNDAPNLPWVDEYGSPQVGNFIRDHFESAKAQGFKVHAILARFADVEGAPEFCFSGSMNVLDLDVAHRAVVPGSRRHETLSCAFTPAERCKTKLAALSPDPENTNPLKWAEADVEPSREFLSAIVIEPELTGMERYQTLPSVLTGYITRDNSFEGKALTKIAGYGQHPFSRSNGVDSNLRDTTPTGPFPLGNYGVSFASIVSKMCELAKIKWDGQLPCSLAYKEDLFLNNTGANGHYVENGDVTSDNFLVSWNLAFGYNWFDGSTFKSPATWDVDMEVIDVLRGIAAQLGCWLDMSDDYDDDGVPIVKFVSVTAEAGEFPSELIPLPDSAEGPVVTENDGVRVKRRGFDGAIIAPANAQNPVDIEIPFGTHAPGYESAPAFDGSRLTLNASLPFASQWKCGHRGQFSGDSLDENGNAALNKDGWVCGSLLYFYDGSTLLRRYPAVLDTFGGGLHYHDDAEEVYRAEQWGQYYSVYACYESSFLTDAERKLRQQIPQLAHAILFGRAIRGQRRQVKIRFRGIVAPRWNSIKMGQAYQFAPVNELLNYKLVGWERDIALDEIECTLEELVSDDLDITWKLDGDIKGNGSMGGAGSAPTGIPGEGVTGDALIRSPEGEDRNTATAQNSGTVPMTLVTAAGTTAQHLRVKRNTGSSLEDVFEIDRFGNVIIHPIDGSNTAGLRFMELASNGTNYVGLKAPDSIAATYTYKLPATPGASGEALGHVGSNQLGWIAAGLTGALVIDPNTPGRNTAQPTDNSTEALITKQKAGMTVSIFESQDSTGARNFYIDKDNIPWVTDTFHSNRIEVSEQLRIDTISSAAGLIIEGAAAQAVGLVEVRDSGLVRQFALEADGKAAFGPVTAARQVDIGGGYATRWGTDVTGLLANPAINDNLALNANTSVLRLTATGGAAFSIGGITGGTDGARLTLHNNSANPLTLVHHSVTSANDNKLSLPGNDDYTVPANGCVTLIYNATGTVLLGGLWYVAHS